MIDVEGPILCAECKKEVKNRAGLHVHVRSHGISLNDYYAKHHPRYNKLTGRLLPFTNYGDYFSRDFETKFQFNKWCGAISSNEDKRYVINKVKKRISDKELGYAPFSLEFKHSFLPELKTIRDIFGSYKAFCDEVGVEPLFNRGLPKNFWDDLPNDLKILCDTREKKPLKFKGIEVEKLKLDVGDYSLCGNYFNNTFVERKSGADLVGTLNNFDSNLERFKKELTRVKESGCYLFIVVESNFTKMSRDAAYQGRKIKVEYLAHTIKELTHEYARCCQFVFADDRISAADLSARLMYHGPKVHRTDIQYYLD
jgi:hypothetical protein